MADAPATETPTRKSDGQGGPPVLSLVPPTMQVAANTPGKPNAALNEAPPKAGEGVNRDHPHAAHLRVIDADRGIVAPPDGVARRKHIAICGFASSTRKYIEHYSQDPAWEIWGLNQLYRHIPRADRWFDIHHNWDKEVVPGTDHRQWARDCGIPFYMMARQPDCPTSVRFPLDAVLGIYRADYFTSTIPYMLSLALMEIDAAVSADLQAYVARTPKDELERVFLQDVTRSLYAEYKIGIFGIDLIVGGEYFHEKPCAEFWVGAMAIGRGIEVLIPPESALCKQLYRYGYEKEPDQLIKTADVEKHMAAATAERDEQLKKLYMLEGVIQADDRWKQLMELRQRGAVIE